MTSKTRAVARDYLELTKPKVVALMLLTMWVGMGLAPSADSIGVYFWATLGVGAAAASAAVFNHLVEFHLDTKMKRTELRPIAQGRISQKNAMLFAFLLGSFGMFVLTLTTNAITTWITLASQAGYAFFYTLFLKRATPQNIVIGGAFGAAPPLLGWLAITGEISELALLLVLIIFTWTPPHFWALAIARKEDYKKINMPMMPVTHGVSFTQLQIVLYSILLLIVSIMPWLCQFCGIVYLGSALLLGARFLHLAILLKSNTAYSWPLFKYSITYLLLLFVALLVDHYL